MSDHDAPADVTAIIAACAREEKTLDSIQRILKCAPPPAEVLVHVDGGNERLANRIKEQIPGVKVLLSHAHVGPGGARNILVQSASHPFVASFDDDSYPVNQDYFAVIISEFEKYPHAAVLGAVVRDIYFPEGPPAPFTHRAAAFVGCGCVYRRSAFLSTSGFVPLKLAYGMEEVDLSMRFHASGGIIVQSSRLAVQHDTDMTHRFTPDVNAAVTSNAALLIFLRYPIALWPLGLMQFCKIVVGLLREGRGNGILRGIFNILSHLYRHRQYRKTLTVRELTSFIALRRRYAREMVPA